jgi:hypothetical protein
MKFGCYLVLAGLALWELPPLWRQGQRRAVLVWVLLAVWAGWLMWLKFWGEGEWYLSALLLG